MSGVVPPLESIGVVAVTAVTVPPLLVAFKVVPVSERFVPRIISSITPDKAVPRPTNLLVVIDVVIVPVVVIAPPDIKPAVAILVTVPLLSAGNACNAPVPSMYCETSPAPVIAKVPEVVIGDPVIVNALGAVNPTEVTVPTN